MIVKHVTLNIVKDIKKMQIETLEDFVIYMQWYDYWKVNQTKGIVKSARNTRKYPKRDFTHIQKELELIIKIIHSLENINQMNKYNLGILQESKKIKETITFKIGDEFTAISGKGSFNKMKEEGLVNDFYNKEKGFIYPFYDGSTSNDHIKGFSSKFSIEGLGIKYCSSGNAGSATYVTGKYHLGGDANVIKSMSYSNHYVACFMNKWLKKFKQGTTIMHTQYNYFKDEYITIPTNHKQLSKHIKLINDFQNQINTIENQINTYIKIIGEE